MNFIFASKPLGFCDVLSTDTSQPCRSMKAGNIVAIFLPLLASADQQVSWWQTGGTEDRLTAKEKLSFSQTSPVSAAADAAIISINRENSYQSIVGFGGALTQSSAYVYKHLPVEVRSELVQSYYAEEVREREPLSDKLISVGLTPQSCRRD